MAILSPAANLPDETAAMQALKALLVHEQASLASEDTDGCAALLEGKAALVAALSAMANERHGRLATAGFAPNEQGMQHWLRQSPDGALDEWKLLMAATREAHELNRVNGVLLAGLSARNRQALSALGANAEGTGLYGPAGRADYAMPRPARAAG